MQKLALSLRRNLFFLNYLLILILLYLSIGTNLQNKFFGFEYEDAFINAQIASTEDFTHYVENFRTLGCNQTLNGECIETSSYTGHYVPYSLYLYTIKQLFPLENFQVHKLGNALLILFFLLFLFKSFRGKIFNILLITIALLSCLPTLYVLNSALIENLSFFLGASLIITIYLFNKTQLEKYKIVAYFLLITIILVKRENFIYLGTLVLFTNLEDYRHRSFWIFMIILLSSQLIINPFYTEGLEASYLNLPTFSWNYFQYQFPVYIKSFLRFDGFLILTAVIFFTSRPSSNSLILLLGWISFIILYGLHYRGQFSIEAGAISHFETFRYMFNTLPFLLGYALFSKKHKSKKLHLILYLVLMAAAIYSLWNSKKVLNTFIVEEQQNYHSINEKINSGNFKDLVLYDNFVLISMLNSQGKVHQIKSFHSCLDLNLSEKTTLIINRFETVKMKDEMCLQELIKVDSLSTENTTVYFLANPSSK